MTSTDALGLARGTCVCCGTPVLWCETCWAMTCAHLSGAVADGRASTLPERREPVPMGFVPLTPSLTACQLGRAPAWVMAYRVGMTRTAMVVSVLQ